MELGQQKELLQQLEEIIGRQLLSIKKSVEVIPQQGLIEIARCQDYFFVGSSYHLPGEGDVKKAYRSTFGLYATGWYEALQLFTQEPGNDVLLNLPTTKSLTAWANKTLKRLGYIGLLKRLMDLTFYQVYDIEFDGDSTYTFNTKVTDVGIEYLEAQNQKWLAQYNYNNSNRGHIDQWGTVVNTQLWEQVNVHNGSFIKYEPTPLLNKYYHIEGTRYIESRLGYDYYPAHVKFGGIAFGDYLNVIACLVGRSLMHRDFCFRAQEKTNFKILIPSNIYTMVIRYDNLAGCIVDQTGITPEIVKQVLSTIILTKEKLSTIYFPSGYAPPILVQLNNRDVISTLIGHQANPLIYLNRCLRFYFEKDYSDAVNEREDQFRDELYQLFDKDILKIPHNIALKTKHKLYTDLDAVLFDKKNNVLLLVQLKFMEDWATDMKQRNSMVDNFNTSIMKWVVGIQDFINENSEDELIKKLSRKSIKAGCTIYKLIIGKHFSQFSNNILPQDFIYANWATVVKTLVQSPQYSGSLKFFIEGLEQNAVKKDVAGLLKNTPTMKFKVGKTIIKVKSQ